MGQHGQALGRGRGGHRLRHFQAALQQQLQHDRAAMGLQLQHVFAGVAVRAGEEQRQAVVQGLALAIVKRQVMGLPGL